MFASERGNPSSSGDDLIPQPIGSVNHAITIHRPPRDVWPWLTQMRSNRAGWYAYDVIDNGGHRSAERILPDYQNIHVGSMFPALPGAKDVFVVDAVRARTQPSSFLAIAQRSVSDHLGVHPRIRTLGLYCRRSIQSFRRLGLRL
jgi:hypothetical protein